MAERRGAGNRRASTKRHVLISDSSYHGRRPPPIVGGASAPTVGSRRKLPSDRALCCRVVLRVNYFPLFFDLRGQKVLVVGAGAVALRKVQLLERAQAAIIVVAPQAAPELAQR